MILIQTEACLQNEYLGLKFNKYFVIKLSQMKRAKNITYYMQITRIAFHDSKTYQLFPLIGSSKVFDVVPDVTD